MQPTVPVAGDPLAKIKSFLANRKHRFSDEYLNALYNNCNQDIHLVRLYVAISGQESSFGTRGHANDGLGTDVNYIGWMYWPNGKRTIMDYQPMAEWAKYICSRFLISKNYHAERIITREGKIYSWENVKKYSGNDRKTVWGNNVSQFYQAMM